MSNVKRIYTFGAGEAQGDTTMKNLLGGKGANLAEMNKIGVPVPAGFTITTDACTEFNQTGKDEFIKLLWDELGDGIKYVEKIMEAKLKN